MNPTVLQQAAPYSARAITWAPIAVTGVAVLLLGVLVRLLDSPAGVVPALATAGLACVVIIALDDRAARLLAPLPTGPMARRLLRLGLATALVGPTWVAAQVLLPGSAGGPAPALALVATGVAFATWSPGERGSVPAAAVPLLWVATDLVLAGRLSPIGDVAGWWRTDPWPVLAAALGALGLGRHR